MNLKAALAGLVIILVSNVALASVETISGTFRPQNHQTFVKECPMGHNCTLSVITDDLQDSDKIECVESSLCSVSVKNDHNMFPVTVSLEAWNVSNHLVHARVLFNIHE